MPGLIRESVTADAAAAVAPRELRVPSPVPGAWGHGWRLARRKPLGAVSALIVLGLVVVAVLAPVLAPRDPNVFNLNERGLPIRMQAPSAAFPLGTDPLGRDVLSRIIYGARVSLVVGSRRSSSGPCSAPSLGWCPATGRGRWIT
jgi:peptide/nickel transport system permease protein